MVLVPDINNIELREEELNELLALAYSLSQQMVGAARAGQWDSVIELEDKRRMQLDPLAGVLALDDKSQKTTDFWRQTIVAIIESDKEVAMLAELQKGELAQEAGDLGSSRKAVNAYLDNL